MPRTSPVHYISPSSISITPNANGSSGDLAVHVSRGAKIKVYSRGIEALGFVSGTYREWTLAGRNRRLNDAAGQYRPYTIYARLPKDDAGGGYVVFAPKVEDGEDWKDRYPYVTMKGLAEDTAGAGTDGYWYVRLGEVSQPSSGRRTVTLDTGILGTDQYNTEWALEPDGLRVELDCLLGGEDAGPTPYVPWDGVLSLQARLAGGGSAEAEVDHWTIARNGEEGADWPGDHTEGEDRKGVFAEDGRIDLYHERSFDDFRGSVSTAFTVTAWGTAGEGGGEGGGGSDPQPAVTGTYTFRLYNNTDSALDFNGQMAFFLTDPDGAYHVFNEGTLPGVTLPAHYNVTYTVTTSELYGRSPLPSSQLPAGMPRNVLLFAGGQDLDVALADNMDASVVFGASGSYSLYITDILQSPGITFPVQGPASVRGAAAAGATGEGQDEDFEALASGIITIMAETEEKYELELSATIVNYDAEADQYDPSSVAVRVRAIDQRRGVSRLDVAQLSDAGLAAQYRLASAVGWQWLAFTDVDPDGAGEMTDCAEASIGKTVLELHDNIDVRLVAVADSGGVRQVDKELCRTTILNYGELKTSFVTVGWFKKIFRIHAGAADTSGAEIEPNSSMSGDGGSPREFNIEARAGLWTNRYVSALGLGPGGGGGGDMLVQPLLGINNAGLGSPPSSGSGKIAIVYNYATARYEWGNASGGLTLKDGNDTITPTVQTADGLTYNLGASFLSLAHGGVVAGDVTVSRSSLAITGGTLTVTHPSGFDPATADGHVVLTKEETETLFAGKYVTVEFWNSLFETYNGTAKVGVNTKNPVFDNLKILVGAWTDQYLSAKGINPQQGGGGSGVGDVTWDLLASSSDTNQISLSHLTDALANYATQSWVGSQGFLNSIPTASATNKGGIKVGSTLAISNEVLNLAAIATGTPSASDATYTKVVVDGYGRVTKAATLGADDIPDISATYATSSRVTTLEGYFTNGVANEAAKLSAVSKTLWGNTYWTSGGVPTSIGYDFSHTASLSNVANINMSGSVNFDIDGDYTSGLGVWKSSNLQILFLGYYTTTEKSYATNIYGSSIGFFYGTSRGMTLDSSGSVGIGTSSPSVKLDVNGYTRTSRLYLYKHATDSTKDVYLEYDNTSNRNGVHLVGAGFYSDSYVSAKGIDNSSGGSGVGDVTWDLLASSSDTNQISLSHLTDALANYATQSWVGSQGFLNSIPTASATNKGGIKVGNTLAISSEVLNLKSITIGTPLDTDTKYTKVVVDSYGRVTKATTLVAADIPNLAASKITNGTFDAARIPDLSATYAKSSRVTTLEGYFTNGVAKEAAKLSATSKTLWGNTYWTSGGVPTSVGYDNDHKASLNYVDNIEMSGDLKMSRNGSGVRFYTDSTYGYQIVMRVWIDSNVLALGYESTLNSSYDTKIYGKTIQLGYKNSNDEIAYGLMLDSSGNVGIGTSSPSVKLDVNGYTRTSRLYLYKHATDSTKDVYLEYDNTSNRNGVHLVGAGFYSDSYVSAKGIDNSGGGGSAVDMDAVWTALASNDSTHKIHNSHLNTGTLTINGNSWNPASGSGTMTIDTGDFKNITLTSDGDYDNHNKYPYSYAAYTTDSVTNLPTGLTGYYTLVSLGTGLRTFQLAAQHYGTGLKYRVLQNVNSVLSFCDWRTIWHSGNFTPSDYLLKTDISDWAKASEKPSYSFSEIDGSATASQVPNIESLNNFSTRVYDKTAKITPNYVLAGPSSGTTTAAATFRKLVAADIPNLSWDKITSGKPTTLSGYGITDGVKNDTTWWGRSINSNGAVTGDIEVGAGNIYLNKGRDIVSKDGNSNRVLMRLGTDNVLIIGSGAAGAGYTTNIYGNSINLCYGTSLTNGITLDSSGKVGIGNTSPSYKFDVTGSIRATGSIYTNSELYVVDSQGTHDMRFAWITQSNVEYFNMYAWENKYWNLCIGYYAGTISSGALVLDAVAQKWGIGYASPKTKLDVNGGVKASKFYLVKPNADDDDGAIYLEYDSTNSGVHLVGAGFYSDSYVSAKGTGNSGSGGAIDLTNVVTDIIPSTGNTYNIGTNGKRWNNVYTRNIDVTNDVTSLRVYSSMGFYVPSKDDTYVLLAGGGTKALDNFYRTNGYTLLGGSSSSHISLNSVNTVGIYTKYYDADTEYVDDRPTTNKKSFKLIVEETRNDHTNYKRQVYQEYDSVNVYERYRNSATLTNWGAWKLVQTDLSSYSPSSMVSSITVGSTSYTPTNGVVTLPEYLPLTGGAITATYHQALVVRTSNTGADNWVAVAFRKYIGETETALGGIAMRTGVDWLQRYNGTGGTFYKIWDEGNDGSGSGLDADLLDGQHGTYYAKESYFTDGVANQATYLKTIVMAAGDNYDEKPTEAQGSFVAANFNSLTSSDVTLDDLGVYTTLVSFGRGNRTIQFKGQGWSSTLKYRYVGGSSPYPLQPWKTIAFTDSNITGNAATATKLADSVNIWGQSFDGSSSISGDLTNTGNITPSATASKNLGSSTLMFEYGYIRRLATQSGYDLRFYTSGTQRMVIGNSDGAVAMTSSLSVGTNIRMNGTLTGCTSIDSLMHFDTTNGYIGIGTSSPNYHLDVLGQIRCKNNSTDNQQLSFGCYSNSNDPYIRMTDANGSFVDALSISNAGSESSPAYVLKVGQYDRQTRIMGTNVRLYTKTSADANTYGLGFAVGYGGRVLLGSATSLLNNNTDCRAVVDGVIGVDGVKFYGVNGVTMDSNGNIIHKTTTNGNYWHIDTNGGTAIMAVTTGGNVGIGETSPATKLHVVGGSGVDAAKLVSANNADPLVLDTTRSYNVIRYSLSGTFKWSIGCNADRFYFYSSSSVFNILNNGNVGIGTTSPTQKLDVDGSLKLNGGIQMPRSGGSLQFYLNDTDKYVIAMRVFTGSNTLSFGYETSLKGYGTNIYGNTVTLYYKNSSNAIATGLYIDTTGKIGINSTSSSFMTDRLNVNGNIRTSASDGAYIKIGGLYLVYDSTNNALKVSASATGNDAANFYATGAVSAKGANTASGGSSVIDLGNVETNILPSTSGTYGIGSDSKRWKVYATTGNFNGALSANGSLSVTGASVMTGDVVMGNTLKVTTRVGINQDVNANYRLAVTGHISVMSGGVFIGEDGQVSLTHKLYVKDGTSYLNGNVGIGGYNASYKLYVNGKSYLNGDTSFGGANTSNLTFDMHKNKIVLGNIFLRSVGDTVYFDASEADEGYVRGYGGCTIVSGSDIRQKDVVSVAECSLDDVARAPIFNFTWKITKKKVLHLGTSAQYWRNIFPYATPLLDDGFYSMDYGATALAAAVITARKVVDHEQRIRLLEVENEALRNEIEQLKKVA